MFYNAIRCFCRHNARSPADAGGRSHLPFDSCGSIKLWAPRFSSRRTQPVWRGAVVIQRRHRGVMGCRLCRLGVESQVRGGVTALLFGANKEASYTYCAISVWKWLMWFRENKTMTFGFKLRPLVFANYVVHLFQPTVIPPLAHLSPTRMLKVPQWWQQGSLSDEITTVE